MSDTSVSYSVRELDVGEFELRATIDRAERIDAQYRVRDGALRAVACDIDVAGWWPGEVDRFVARLEDPSRSGFRTLSVIPARNSSIPCARGMNAAITIAVRRSRGDDGRLAGSGRSPAGKEPGPNRVSFPR